MKQENANKVYSKKNKNKEKGRGKLKVDGEVSRVHFSLVRIVGSRVFSSFSSDGAEERKEVKEGQLERRRDETKRERKDARLPDLLQPRQPRPPTGAVICSIPDLREQLADQVRRQRKLSNEGWE